VETILKFLLDACDDHNRTQKGDTRGDFKFLNREKLRASFKKTFVWAGSWKTFFTASKGQSIGVLKLISYNHLVLLSSPCAIAGISVL
jgi:hypothetical protein